MSAAPQSNIIAMVKRLDGEFYTISEVAKEVGRSVDTIRTWIKKGVVEGPVHVMPVGKTTVNLFTPADIARFKEHADKSGRKTA